jgi:hypothetical protein
MTATTLSVTRALAELKRLDDRITRAIGGGVFIGLTVGTGTQTKVQNNPNITSEQLKGAIQGAFDSVTELFNQRAAIKAAIVKSNANTTVTLGNKTLTVAEAIELKQSINTKRTLVTHLQRQYTNAQTAVATLNAALEAAIDSNLKTIYGSEKGKNDKDTYDLIANPQKAAKAPALVDPLNLAEKIKEIEEEISLVDTELDFTLSEVNAKTTIVVG